MCCECSELFKSELTANAYDEEIKKTLTMAKIAK